MKIYINNKLKNKIYINHNNNINLKNIIIKIF